jgi:hypothetical protein
MIKIVFILLVLASPVFGGTISAGIKAGLPLTDVVQTAGEIGRLPFRADVNRFAVGPMLQVRLPSGVGIEAGAIYKRFDQEAGQVQVTVQPPVENAGLSSNNLSS